MGGCWQQVPQQVPQHMPQEGCWQQVPRTPQVVSPEQSPRKQQAPMWNGCEGGPQPPNAQLSSAYNSDMYQDLNVHHSLDPRELYPADAFPQHGDLTQNGGWTHPWNMQT